MQIAIAIVEHNGRFLVGRRPQGVPLAGRWEFPGGKVESDETPSAAARRECQEETGLAIQVRSPLAEIQHTYDHGLLTLHFFLAALERPASPDPTAPFVWLPLDALLELEFPPANAPILKMLADDPTIILAKEMI